LKPKREWKEGKVHWSNAKEIYLEQMDKEHKKHIKSMKLKTLAFTIHQRLEQKKQQNPKNQKPLKKQKA
jgi:hypothetical protein